MAHLLKLLGQLDVHLTWIFRNPDQINAAVIHANEQRRRIEQAQAPNLVFALEVLYHIKFVLAVVHYDLASPAPNKEVPFHCLNAFGLCCIQLFLKFESFGINHVYRGIGRLDTDDERILGISEEFTLRNVGQLVLQDRPRLCKHVKLDTPVRLKIVKQLIRRLFRCLLNRLVNLCFNIGCGRPRQFSQ